MAKRLDAVLHAQNLIIANLIHHLGVSGQGFFSSPGISPTGKTWPEPGSTKRIPGRHCRFDDL
jgi:hypothetical protein